MKKNLWMMGLLSVCVFVFSSCQPPKYALYTSIQRDFQCNVPWAWSVMADSEGKYYTNVAFIGPFESDFYLGVPSFSVRWYSRYMPHRLRDGSVEMYAGADDYIEQTLSSVYGPQRVMIKPVSDVLVAGRKAKHFVVASAGPISPQAKWGAAVDAADGRVINPRQHAYVVVPMSKGFYVIVYPATQAGYPKYEPQLNQLVNSFVILKDGPGGAVLPAAAPAVSKK